MFHDSSKPKESWIDDFKKICLEELREKPTTSKQAQDSKTEYSRYVMLLVLLIKLQNVKHYVQLKTFSSFFV